jgi:3-oxoacyl-[acyl-carrier protein] reductase
MDLTFKNKTVLITGATRGIGKQIASDFEELGANLILTSRSANKIYRMNQKLNAHEYHSVDFTNDLSMKKFLVVLNEIEKVDICINNAGINEITPFFETQETDWNNIMDVNLKAPFIVSQKVAEKMKKQKWGRIINIASIFGVISRDNRVVYSTSKSGLIGLTRAMAIDLAPYNILVNSISAGFVDTDMTRTMLSATEIKELEKKIPLGRLATAKDISKVVVFLASDMNSYITGQNLIADGGYVIT